MSIVNVVATASIGQNIDFNDLWKFKEISYDSDVYGGRVAYLKTREMAGKISLFASGKMISAGAKSESQAFHELDAAKSFLVNNCISSNLNSVEPKTQNIVVSADFEENINLEKLSEASRAIYEPEQFPGAILKMETPFKVTILLFASGKVVIAGLKSELQIEPTIKRIKELMHSIS